jgi:hypothetical protein
MLSSNISSVSKTSLSVHRCLAPTSATFVRSARGLPRGPRSYQQSRSFRIGYWSSYLDPNFQKEIHRRHRVVKHKYIEAITRKLSWDRHFPIPPQKGAFKGFMCSAWHARDPRPGGRWVDTDEVHTVRNKSAKGREKGIEDVEESAVDKLLFNRKSMYDHMRAQSQLLNNLLRSSMASMASATTSTSHEDPSTTSKTYGQEQFRKRFQSSDESNSEPSYVIDPITNRKVYKNKTSESTETTRKAIDIPVKTFKTYRSRFQQYVVPEHLREYEEKHPYGSTLAEQPATAAGSEADASKLEGIPEFLEEFEKEKPYPRPIQDPDPVQESLRDYDAQVDYASRAHYDCSGIDVDRNCPVQKGLQEYDDKISIQFKAFKEKGQEVVKTLEGYKKSLAHLAADTNPFKINLQPEKPLNETPEKMKKPSPTPDESDQDFLKIVDSYKRSALYRNKTEDELDAQHEEILHAPPEKKGEGLVEAIDEYQESVSHPTLAAIERYKINSQLDEVQNAENGPVETKTHDPVQQGLEDYDSKVKYDPFWYQRGDKSPELVQNTPGLVRKFFRDLAGSARTRALRSASEQTPEDIDLLRASDVRASSGIIKDNDRNKETESEKRSKRKELENDFEQQQSVPISSPDEQVALRNIKKLYGDVVHDSIIQNELESSSAEFQRRDAHPRARVNAKIAEVEAGRADESAPPRTMTGNYVRDFPEEFETSWIAEDGSLKPKSKTARETEIEVQGEEKAYVNGLASQEAYVRSPGTRRLETALTRDTQRSVKTENGDTDTVQANIDPAQQGEGDLSASVSSFGNAKQDKADEQENGVHYLNGSQTKMLNKEKEKELIQEVRSIYEDTYGAIDCEHRQVPEPKSASESISTAAAPVESSLEVSEPTVYKILAYDPTMQSISIAETTSIVTDSSQALTPAEVLLRLSNPAKFFPHFGPLQSQGYEIISGSGDVLVFRKVRAASPIKAAEAASNAALHRKKKVTNPIDGMQTSPVAATGDFASPTGFVNHDLPRGSETSQPFKSNIDVRREEAVFSGKSNWQEGERPKNGGRVKKVVIGAAWVAACSYAVGVVAEFFRTGGVDGIGPQGF